MPKANKPHAASRRMLESCTDAVVLQTVESLEKRILMAGEPWGRTPELIGLDSAADTYSNYTGSGQTIAVIDTGIDYTRPQFGAGFGPGKKVVGGYDFVDNDSDPIDTYGHGTRVAGILAADDFIYNGFHYRGVAPDARLVALRIDESNEPVPDERMEDALKWIIDHREEFDIGIVNISFGFGSYSEDEVSEVFGDELASLKAAGVFIVASSGNEGVGSTPGIDYPAADPAVMSVGAVDTFGTIADYTERGSLLDMLAPGDSVPTTEVGNPNDPSETLTTASGTSFAAPFVAGTIALMRQVDESLTPEDIASILRASSKNTVDGDDEFGPTTDLIYPLLQVDNAIALTIARKTGLVGNENGDASFANNNSLAYDRDGVLHLAFFDTGDGKLKYATRNSDDSGWSVTSVIDASDRILGQYVSLAHDQFGRPAVAYFDGTAGDLKYAEFNGLDWTIQTLDSKGSTGLYPSLVFDHDDRPVIAYYNKAGGALRLARRSGGNWTVRTIDSKDDVGRSTSIAVNSDGRLGIAYENTTTGRLRYAQEQADGSFVKVDVDSNTLGVAWISLAFDPSNRPTISYYDAFPANLKFAQFDGSAWKTETLVAKGATGLYSTLLYDQAGKANIFYYNRKGNQLTQARGAFGDWSYTTLEPGGGRYASATIDDDGEISYTWSSTDDKVLHIETL